jgi:GNAT superfamily N-acetyltransferase
MSGGAVGTGGGQRSPRAGRTTVWQAGMAEIDAVAVAFTAGSMDEAVAAWMLPDEARRRRLAPDSARSFLAGMIATGEVVVAGTGAGDIAGVSLWQHMNGTTQPPPAGEQAALEAAMREAYGEYWPRVALVNRVIAERHPHHEPHLYLQAMVVVPARRGAGIGGAMLRHRLAQADIDGVAAYLEASTPRNRALYERHGFEPAGSPIELPDGPTLQPMWRAPRPS